MRTNLRGVIETADAGDGVPIKKKKKKNQKRFKFSKMTPKVLQGASII